MMLLSDRELFISALYEYRRKESHKAGLWYDVGDLYARFIVPLREARKSASHSLLIDGLIGQLVIEVARDITNTPEAELSVSDSLKLSFVKSIETLLSAEFCLPAKTQEELLEEAKVLANITDKDISTL